jgi:hypothetical protein
MLSEEETELLYPDLVGIQWLREGEAFCIRAQTEALWVHAMITTKVQSKYWPIEPPVNPE